MLYASSNVRHPQRVTLPAEFSSAAVDSVDGGRREENLWQRRLFADYLQAQLLARGVSVHLLSLFTPCSEGETEQRIFHDAVIEEPLSCYCTAVEMLLKGHCVVIVRPPRCY